MLHSSRKISCCARRSSEGGSARSSRHRVRVSGTISTARSEGEHTLGGKVVELPPIRNPCEPRSGRRVYFFLARAADICGRVCYRLHLGDLSVQGDVREIARSMPVRLFSGGCAGEGAGVEDSYSPDRTGCMHPCRSASRRSPAGL